MMNAPLEHQHAVDPVAAINKRTGRNMPQAIMTGALLVAIILATLLFDRVWFVYLVVSFSLLALWELRVDFATAGIRIPVVMLWLCSVGTILFTYYYDVHLIGLAIGMMATLILVLLSATTQLTIGNRLTVAVENKIAHSDEHDRALSAQSGAISEPHHSKLTHIAVSLFSVLYIPLLASIVVLTLTMRHPVAHAYMIVFLPALSDIGGLFIGAWFGKHKLSPRISPKKSVEGLIGSIAFATAGAYAIFAYAYAAQLASSWWIPCVAGIIAGVSGTFGDLSASLLKRDIGIKDMGHLLKGHGGVMDRVDSILITAPLLALLFWVTGI